MNPNFRSPVFTLRLVFGIALLALLARAFTFYHPDGLIDDAYISFRYAANLIQGNGLVFNVGEYVEGYTNFLWTLLLAGAAAVGFDMAGSSVVLAGLFAAGTLWLLYRIGLYLVEREGLPVWVAALPMLFWVAHGAIARYIVSGMETLLFTFLVTLGVYGVLRGSRPFLIGLVFGIAALARPEGVLYGGLAWLCLLATLPTPQRWRGAGAFLVGAALVYTPYFVWRYVYYGGYLFPNTYYAKTSGFQWVRLVRGMDVLRYTLTQSALWIPSVVAGLALLGRQGGRVIGVALLFIVTTLVYFVYVGGDFVIWFGPRFFLPIFPLFFILVALGIYRLVAWLSLLPVLAQRRDLWQRGVGVAAGGVLAFYLLSSAWIATPAGMVAFAEQMRGWRELGSWLRATYPPDTTIATDAAGLIPYYSGFETLDMFGLTDAYIAHLDMPSMGSGTVAHEKYDPAYVLAQNPTCIISTYVTENGIPAAAGLGAVQTELLARYQLVAVAKKGGGAPADGRWVIPATTYQPEWAQSGYVTGAFCQPQ